MIVICQGILGTAATLRFGAELLPVSLLPYLSQLTGSNQFGQINIEQTARLLPPEFTVGPGALSDPKEKRNT